jgi:hypothetical protein
MGRVARMKILVALVVIVALAWLGYRVFLANARR